MKASCILEFDQYSFIGIDPIASISGKGDYSEALRKLRREFPDSSPVGYITFEGEYFFQVYRTATTFDRVAEVDVEVFEIEVDKSDEEYAEMVELAKEHLRAGDVYQIVLSREFRGKINVEPLQFYCALRKTEAPYRFFFQLEDRAIVGASPEKLISVQDGLVESMPIAGTYPKGEPIEKLLSDPKEIAEHVMLVDLARNDLGVVCESVHVEEFKVAKTFSHVTHIVSKVRGKLAPEFDAIDALKASFPAGTLSGAPKKRAMELIAQIEGKPRGLYGGAIVAIDTKGNLFSCIAIRTAQIQEGLLKVRAGAGIVLDSDPLKEAKETQSKASTILCF